MNRRDIERALAEHETIDWEETEFVGCDRPCFALRNPVTLADYMLAHEHWKKHDYMKGCSHGS